VNLKPINISEANEFVASFHRHNNPVVGARFCIGVQHEGMLVGVAIVGRPVARMADNGFTAEITRLCVSGAPKNACSMLYRSCWRAWVAMGGLKLITYTMQAESGSSLRGAGFKVVGEVNAEHWHRESRPREWQPIYGQQKLKWELT